MTNAEADEWVTLPTRTRTSHGLTISIRPKRVAITREVRAWFTEQGFAAVQLKQNKNSGRVALIGTEGEGYALKRGSIGGYEALRSALGIADNEKHQFRLEPAAGVPGLVIVDDDLGAESAP